MRKHIISKLGLCKSAKKIFKQRNTQNTNRKARIIPIHKQTKEKTNRDNVKLVQPAKIDTCINLQKLSNPKLATTFAPKAI